MAEEARRQNENEDEFDEYMRPEVLQTTATAQYLRNCACHSCHGTIPDQQGQLIWSRHRHTLDATGGVYRVGCFVGLGTLLWTKHPKQWPQHYFALNMPPTPATAQIASLEAKIEGCKMNAHNPRIGNLASAVLAMARR